MSLGFPRQLKQKSRKGAAAVEFAIVAPLMMMLTIGMIEVGRMVMVKQLMVNASREGARLGTLPESSHTDVVSRVNEELASVGISGVAVNVTPSNLEFADAGTPVTVALSVPTRDISWINTSMFNFNSNIDASTTMRRESQ